MQLEQVAPAEPKQTLTREIGLLSYFSIGAGNMLGVPVFIIPGLAAILLGPTAFLSYALAAVVAVTAALSVSELVTAMPETGGSYHFLDRAMGPMTGTVAGLGTWLISIFKGAFAAFAFGQFLFLVTGLDFRLAVLLLVAGLVAVNVRGVRHTGTLQTLIVLIILSGLSLFVLLGVGAVDLANFTPTLPAAEQVSGIFTTGAIVIFSYVGLVKVTAVAGEVRDPGRTIPRGVLLVTLAVTVAHLAVLTVLLGVLGAGGIGNPITAVLDAAQRFLGPVGSLVLLVTALVAFASTANTAILFSGRYPYAMAHEALLPPALGRLSHRYLTPYLAILVSGAAMLLLAWSLDVATLAEITSSFALLIFLLLHAAVLLLRRSSPAWYRPSFRSPAFPWIQGAGILGALLLLVALDPVAQLAITVFVLGGLVWYFAYARPRTRPRGELREVVHRGTLKRAVREAEARVSAEAPRVLLPIDDPHHARDLLHLTSWLTGGGQAFVRAVRVEPLPPQTPLVDVAALPMELPQDLMAEVARDAVEFGLGAELLEVFAHEPAKALLAASEEGEFSLLLLDRDSAFFRALSRGQIRHLLHNPSLDVVLFRDRGLHDRDRVLLASSLGPFDELEVAVASGVAEAGGEVTMLRVLPPRAPASQEEAVARYHEALHRVLTPTSSSRILRSSAPARAIAAEAEHHDLLVMRASREPKVRGSVFGRTADRVAAQTTCSLVFTSRAEAHPRRWLRWLLHRSLG